MAVRFDENDVRPMGRTARCVRGMNLEDDQKVIAMLVAGDESQSVLTATEKRIRQADSYSRIYPSRSGYKRHDRYPDVGT